MNWIRIGAILAFCAVLLGTFGAHGLPEYLEKIIPKDDMRKVAGLDVPYRHNYIEVFNTGVKYHIYHALALLFLGLYKQQHKHRLLDIVGHCFLWGTILFSGSLYVLVVTYIKPIAMITPIGGILYLVGWICLIVALYMPVEQKGQG
jgi:uncharacterized membrane protein YgdD (TMEM256/DUF423 family)